MANYGHKIQHTTAGDSLSSDVSPTKKRLHEHDMDVLPIAMSEKIKAHKAYTSIARTEFKITRLKREANVKGQFYLSQLPKALEGKDNEMALTILAAARRQFKAAENKDMLSQVNANHVKIKGEVSP